MTKELTVCVTKAGEKILAYAPKYQLKVADEVQLVDGTEAIVTAVLDYFNEETFEFINAITDQKDYANLRGKVERTTFKYGDDSNQ